MNRSNPSPRAASTITALLLAAALLGGPSVSTVAADATIATTTTLSPSSLNPKPTGRTSEIMAVVAPVSGSVPIGGTMTLYDDDGGARTEIDAKPVGPDPFVQGMTSARFTLPADMPEATYHLVAAYGGDANNLSSESDPVTVVAGPRPTSTTVAITGPHDGSGATAQKGDTIVVTANVTDTGDYNSNFIPFAGDVTIRVDGVVVATTTANGQVELATASWTLGTHSIGATYDGDGVDHSGSTGATSLQLLANVVEASGVGVSAATFYPYKDGYRDTVTIRGARAEPISVAISIFSPAGARIRAASIARAAGSYAFAWNGRNSNGSAAPAGRYKVVQVLTDALGAKRTSIAYTTISAKRLYASTTYVTKAGSAYTAKGSGGGGTVTRFTSGGYVKLAAGSSGNGYAAAGWELTLPSATVYRSIAWQVYAKYPLSTSPTGIGIQDFSQCPRSSTWNDGCFDHWRSIGNGTYSPAWYSTTGSVTTNRFGRYVRGIVEGIFDTTYVYKVRVKVTYAVLR